VIVSSLLGIYLIICNCFARTQTSRFGIIWQINNYSISGLKKLPFVLNAFFFQESRAYDLVLKAYTTVYLNHCHTRQERVTGTAKGWC